MIEIIINVLIGAVSFVTGVVFATYRIKKKLEDPDEAMDRLSKMADNIDEEEILE